MANNPNTSNRGFASMDPAKQREIARKGGYSVSRNRQHMSEIGRKGGANSHGGRSKINAVSTMTPPPATVTSAAVPATETQPS